jgi:hypothetical protein
VEGVRAIMTEGSTVRVRATQAYLNNDRNPLRLKTGDMITVGHRDGVWTGYVWGCDDSGHAAWVPEEFLERRGEREAALRRNYDSADLTVVKGDELDVLAEAGGWCLCSTSAGVTGWLPEEILEPM